MRTIELKGNQVKLIDQTLLPNQVKFVKYRDVENLAKAIEEMKIRGAPALGAAAGFGLAMTVLNSKATEPDEMLQELKNSADRIRKTRPTAVNLFSALNRVMGEAGKNKSSIKELREAVVKEAEKIAEDDTKINYAMGREGSKLIDDGDTILTHCNAGFLATSGEYGTALGVIKVSFEQGKNIRVIATETRPLLQGARLTAWELKQDGIPVTLIIDNTVGRVMNEGLVDKVIVGADRISINGDVANKIGTYSIAILARKHDIPFHVAAPLSTIDPETENGEGIEIEYRSTEEITKIADENIAPEGIKVLNPAFDVTPRELIDSIITEEGVFNPNEIKSLFD